MRSTLDSGKSESRPENAHNFEGVQVELMILLTQAELTTLLTSQEILVVGSKELLALFRERLALPLR
jgi:hypothetical protein